MSKRGVPPVIRNLNRITDDIERDPVDRINELYDIAAYAMARARDIGLEYHWIGNSMRHIEIVRNSSLPPRQGRRPKAIEFADDPWHQAYIQRWEEANS